MTDPDVADVPPVWRSRVAYARIEFRLADRDPDGNATTGITRTPTAATSSATFRDDVKSSSTGGADPWPSDDYLNVWVCGDLRDGRGRSVLGYAQFPGGPPTTDGVVVVQSCFGQGGSARRPSPSSRGREGVELLLDGTYIQYGSGPDDRGSAVEGRRVHVDTTALVRREGVLVVE